MVSCALASVDIAAEGRVADGLAPPSVRRIGLTIRVSSGSGRGATGLSAFDAALRAAGVADFNLIRLSSVIPAASQVVQTGPQGQLRGNWGDRLFCVYAAQRAYVPSETAWAGVGWVLRSDGSGAGLFAEHEGTSRAEVRGAIQASLADLSARRGGAFGPVQMQLIGATCNDQPVCAVVVAAYQTSSWDSAR